ncbi:viral ankyrin [Cotesia vestalis bracovirus]|nr:viral ankyrin [Cotesia vestalis bracovirus]QZB49058.1 V-ankyrin [Cotesia vestalis bracovirus]
MHSDGLLQFLSAQDNNGDNYFHEACRSNSLDHFERVVKFVEYPIPAILTQRNSSGEQCTHIIAKSQKHYAVEMMKIVMDLGADINGKEKFSGFTPLHLCVWKKNYELAEWLCQVPWIDLDARDHKGHTAWHMAYVNADFKMINILRWSRTEPKFISVKAMLIAQRISTKSVLSTRLKKITKMESNKLLQMLSDRSCLGENYFHEACEARSLALLERAERWMDKPMPSLLTERNFNGEQCTHIIARNKNDDAWEMMYIVWKLGADINGQEMPTGYTPLQLCVWERNYELAEWMCRRLPDIDLEATNSAGQTAYQLAVERNDPIFKELLKKTRAKDKLPNVRKSARIAKLKRSK